MATVSSRVVEEDTLTIDTRTPDEHNRRTDAHVPNGHTPGAHNVDRQQHNVDLFDPTRVRTYSASWMERFTDPALPIE